MKTIELTKGQVTLVDDEDFDWLSRRKWYAQWNRCTQSYYAVRSEQSVDGKQHQVIMSRFILGLEYGDPRQADHIHHDTLDNRRSELRIVTHRENHFNRANAKGYCWKKADKKYLAYIQVNGHKAHLGSFDTVLEAHTTHLFAKGRLYVMPGCESRDYLTVGAEG